MDEDSENGAKYKFPIAPRGETFACFTDPVYCCEGSLGKGQRFLKVEGGLQIQGEPVAEPP